MKLTCEQVNTICKGDQERALVVYLFFIDQQESHVTLKYAVNITIFKWFKELFNKSFPALVPQV